MVTGVVEEQSAVPTLRLMAGMFPEAKKSYVVYEATTPSGQESARNTMRALSKIKATFAGPVFALQQHGIDHGVLGGRVISHIEQGKYAGNMVPNILSGMPVSEISVVTKSPDIFMFDYREMERLGLDKAQLSRNSKVLNYPFISLEEYSNWLIIGAIAIALQMTLIVFLIRTISHRRKAVSALRQSDNRLRGFLDHSPSTMYVKDRDHRLVMVNAR
jgi:PAS domain-containing protein